MPHQRSKGAKQLEDNTNASKGSERPLRRPAWLKVQLQTGGDFQAVRQIMRSSKLHTVCEEAKCPNIYECWVHKTATFMILGDTCTRACRFCAVHSGKPTVHDLEEPGRVAEAVMDMGLRHVVITSVARDDLEDGGAGIFAKTIEEVRKAKPDCTIEVLIPDFMGNWEALQLVMDAKPHVLNHNIETVRRLSDGVRSKAKYNRTLELLKTAKTMQPQIPTKSSIMVGVGEEVDEVLETLDDLRNVGVSIVTIGQYLQPTRKHLNVMKYYTPEEFSFFKDEGKKRGFEHVESGPLVRSSYHAHEQASGVLQVQTNR